MLDENQMIHPGRSGDSGDAALDAALAAADEDLLSAISNGLDLDMGLARILGTWVDHRRLARASQAPAHPEADRRITGRHHFPRIHLLRIHTRGTGASPIDVAVLIRRRQRVGRSGGRTSACAPVRPPTSPPAAARWRSRQRPRPKERRPLTG